MRYNFKRLSGREWYNTVTLLRARGLRFLEYDRSDYLFDPEYARNPFNAYYYRTLTSCRLIYYDDNFQKRFREISFSPKEINPIYCVATFRKIAANFKELLPYEPESKIFTNGVACYYKKAYKGYSTSLDMNSAYLYALKQPLADWQTRTECTIDDVLNSVYDYYCFENALHCEMVYVKDREKLLACLIWADLKIYGYKASIHYEKTANELFRLKKEVNKERYKNVANIAIGCMHKHSGKQNNTTLAASLYAWFSWFIDDLVAKFEKNGYNVIMITTDAIKLRGKYNPESNIVKLGEGLGEFKVEFEGEAEFFTEGHYEQGGNVKWKGKPLYMIEGNPRCKFIENLEEELPIYEKYAVT